MPDGNLSTTNVLLGVLALMSVLQTVIVLGAGLFALSLYRRSLEAVRHVEGQVAPLVQRLDRLAGNAEEAMREVKAAAALAASGVERAGAAVQTAVAVVGLASGAARSTAGVPVRGMLGLARGLQVAYRTFIAAPNGSPRVRRRRQSASEPDTTTQSQEEVRHGRSQQQPR